MVPLPLTSPSRPPPSLLPPLVSASPVASASFRYFSPFRRRRFAVSPFRRRRAQLDHLNFNSISAQRRRSGGTAAAEQQRQQRSSRARAALSLHTPSSAPIDATSALLSVHRHRCLGNACRTTTRDRARAAHAASLSLSQSQSVTVSGAPRRHAVGRGRWTVLGSIVTRFCRKLHRALSHTQAAVWREQLHSWSSFPLKSTHFPYVKAARSNA